MGKTIRWNEERFDDYKKFKQVKKQQKRREKEEWAERNLTNETENQ